MDVEKIPKADNPDIDDTVDGSDESIEQYDGFTKATNDQIQNLARTLSHQSFHSSQIEDSNELIKYLSHMSQVPGIETFHDGIDDRLNPDSDSFDAKFWVKNLRKLRDSDEDYYKHNKLGIGYKNLVASGIATDSDYLSTVSNGVWKFMKDNYNNFFNDKPERYFDILKSMDGLMLPGEVTVVLGRPGSGCSTLLKTIASQTYGFKVSPESQISYDGLSPSDIKNNHRGDVIYSAETDIHFPNLMVGDTLEFAARMRTPQNRGNVDRETYAKHLAAVYMAMYGLSHTRYTKVGNDFIRGVSGGERKRVSIAEASLSGANLQCWDNATRGLDAATALEFIRALKTSAAVMDTTPLIAIYQCSQDAYDLFDNVVLLYEGYQIFFGKAKEAKQFFLDMGYDCPARQTTADFLTSITNPAERIVRPGFENRVPRTSKEFETYWKNSPEYQTLLTKIDDYFSHCHDNDTKAKYLESHVAKQSNHVRPSSPYTVSFWMQIRYVSHRNFLRMKSDPSITLFSVLSQVIMALIVSSFFYNMQPTTDTFYKRGVSMFTACFFNAFASLLEIMTLFEARPIVEKHKQYALYRPSADGLASIATEFPVKIAMSLGFNLIFYFMVHYRREPGRFFFYLLTMFSCTISMSHIFRTIGATTKTMASAMTFATAILIGLVVFTGFSIPTPSMLGWSRWMNYIDPMGFAFESLLVNEFHGVNYLCSQFIPSGGAYDSLPLASKICSVVGAVQGEEYVSGDEYLRLSYRYSNDHKWRNWGIMIGFVVFFLIVYLVIIEFNKGAMQKGEIVLFLKSALKNQKKQAVDTNDEENQLTNEKINMDDQYESSSGSVKKMENSNIFHWKDLTYQVKVKSEDRILLNHVDGWVKPGQLTALMGSSGAGKTTLLNTLSERLTVGVISEGNRMVNGHPLDSSFQRTIGYAQQQDVHLPTSTVREALRFSAYLRQPANVSIKEKEEYVEYVIDLLEMSAYADAVVGVAGEGLNVEQRKRLTIGVELAAKPKLLLFLDEPTSGLDSQTAWSICKLMRKLADHGQAILCTIHQPSAILLQEFDRLLFLQKGGQTVYFGDLGENCSTLIKYFERNGSDPCPPEANPAEWMLHVVGAAPGSHAKQDYFEVWRNSPEYEAVQKELDYFETELVKLPRDIAPDAHKTYATPIYKQYLPVTWRIIVSFWRTPSYIYSKIFLTVSSSLYIGFVFFNAHNNIQGLQNQMFAVFMTFVSLFTLLQQILPYFIFHRSIYEIREAPSRTFSWITFILGIMSAEIFYQFFMGTIFFFCWFYPVGFYKNMSYEGNTNERAALIWLFVTFNHVFISTLSHLAMSFNEVMENAGNLAMFVLTICFNNNGVLVQYNDIPGFWKFVYRVNPFTYIVQGVLSAGLANAPAYCEEYELLKFTAPDGETCGSFMNDFIGVAGGQLMNNQTSNCEYCSYTSTNQFLDRISASYSERWRNFGILCCFIVFNFFLTILFYWLARVPKGTRQKK
ncbi:pleiotropic ABC efflux transporter of multiple drugs Cdr1p [[Candida] jaroonii]|uniref:Pleiotropic ABC efflux transporter of multiple drugs Cdr1p n=1 Tax=[Candida] jaroonii TaxID=467808 RepID=A0ACA9Y4Y6_9ASCO|nr:pleiotropic ABC efflux transporter of multiple drugs Cdr1p [[Candida] jaroonii]